MLKGSVSAIAMLAAVASQSWGQVPPGGPFRAQYREAANSHDYTIVPTGGVGPSPIMPPNLGGTAEPYSGLPYPPPANWEAFDPNGPSGGDERGPEACRLYTHVEYLLWFAKSMGVNSPLVTTSAPGDQGVIGANTTTILYPANDIGFNQLNGFRVTVGYFKDADHRWAIEGSGYLLEKKSRNFTAFSQSTGAPVLARPFIDVNAGGTNAALIITTPANQSGGIIVATYTQSWGAELNKVLNFYRSCPTDICGISVSGLFGAKFNSLVESLEIASRSNVLNQEGIVNVFNGQQLVGDFTVGIRDHFKTTNEFYGGQFGMSMEVRYGRCMLGLSGKLAMGVMHQIVQVQGETVAIGNAGIVPAQGGLYAQGSMIGKFRNDEFAIVPEVNLTMGYHFCSWLVGTIGYNMLYMNKVVRPGEMVTGLVNRNQVPFDPTFGLGGAQQPVDLFRQTDFWLQGVNFGLSIRY